MTKRERRYHQRKKEQKQWPAFVHISTPGVCENCGEQTDGLMTCYYAHDDSTTRLCPSCMEEDGSFCFGCGQFCAGIDSFDFIHPGYCDNCWDEIQSNDYDGDDDDYGSWPDEPYEPIEPDPHDPDNEYELWRELNT